MGESKVTTSEEPQKPDPKDLFPSLREIEQLVEALAQEAGCTKRIMRKVLMESFVGTLDFGLRALRGTLDLLSQGIVELAPYPGNPFERGLDDLLSQDTEEREKEERTLDVHHAYELVRTEQPKEVRAFLDWIDGFRSTLFEGEVGDLCHSAGLSLKKPTDEEGHKRGEYDLSFNGNEFTIECKWVSNRFKGFSKNRLMWQAISKFNAYSRMFERETYGFWATLHISEDIEVEGLDELVELSVNQLGNLLEGPRSLLQRESCQRIVLVPNAAVLVIHPRSCRTCDRGWSLIWGEKTQADTPEDWNDKIFGRYEKAAAQVRSGKGKGIVFFRVYEREGPQFINNLVSNLNESLVSKEVPLVLFVVGSTIVHEHGEGIHLRLVQDEAEISPEELELINHLSSQLPNE